MRLHCRLFTCSNSPQEYQSSLEECLAWLLEADEKLKEMAPVSETDVETVKRQFKEHEVGVEGKISGINSLQEYMLRLRESQESVGKVLRRGQALVKSGRLNTESTNIVVKQVTVVNERWEALRAAAMTRQVHWQCGTVKKDYVSSDRTSRSTQCVATVRVGQCATMAEQHGGDYCRVGATRLRTGRTGGAGACAQAVAGQFSMLFVCIDEVAGRNRSRTERRFRSECICCRGG